MFPEDRSLFFRDFGVPATFNGETASVLFDAPERMIDATQISADYLITYPTGTFKTLRYGDSIVVNGTTYTVDTVMTVDDGQLTQTTLSKP